ncbi:MAG: hypothetical protein AB7T63_04080 [Planctomycetota bacterium]
MLASLDSRFTATIEGARAAELPAGRFRILKQHGILVSDPDASSIARCVCDEKEADCVVRVDTEKGRYRGRCGVYGVEVAVTIEQVRRYRFVWEAWARWLREKNSLAGPDPALGIGVMYVGRGQVGDREFCLVVVAPGCQRAQDVAVPEVARRLGLPVVALLLGQRSEDLRVGATLPPTALAADFGTIDDAALGRALGAVVKPPATERKRPGRPQTEFPQSEQVARVIRDRRERPTSYQDLSTALPSIKNMRAAVTSAMKRYPRQIVRVEDAEGWVTFSWRA